MTSKIQQGAKQMKRRLKQRLNKAINKAKKTINSIYRKAKKLLLSPVPSTVSYTIAAILVIALLALVVHIYHLVRKPHPSSYTVMITNMAGNSGGSGVVIKNTPSESFILTNKHVCDGVLKKGGKIRRTNGEEHVVTGYLTDIEHDLCVLTVAADLERSISIADSAPVVYTEATITGHPALMPNIITKGHFGGREIIQLIVGVRKCKDSDKEDPNLAPFCAFFGLAPIIRNYESQVVSATIMGGSSGSAVLNERGELSGLVFAGNARGLSYAFIVPYEAVKNFAETAVLALSKGYKNRPWLEAESGALSEQEEMSIHEARDIIISKCSEPGSKDPKILELCQMVSEDIRF
jgi:S1-C subfamily serine protease